jgi:hypothetical protein
VRRLLAAALVTALAAPTLGCGGDAAATKADYVAQLNAMCEDFAARERQIGEPHTLADVAERGQQIASAYEQAIADKVLELEPPREIAGQAARLRNLSLQQRDVLRRLAEAARNHDLARVRVLAGRNATLNSEAGELAGRLGADSCSGP